MPGDPKCPKTSIIPKVKYSERKISFDTLRKWDTFFGCILILHKSGLDCVTMRCLRRSDTTDRDPTFTSPPHRRVVSYVPQPYHSHTMSYVPPMSHICPSIPHCVPRIPWFVPTCRSSLHTHLTFLSRATWNIVSNSIRPRFWYGPQCMHGHAGQETRPVWDIGVEVRRWGGGFSWFYSD